MAGETDEQMVPCGYLTGIKFDLMNNGDIEKLSNASIVEMNDLTNPKLGLPNGSSQCATCGSKTVKDCDGHFGVIKLPATIYHPYFIAEIVQILNQICPGCLTIKHDTDMEGFILELNDKSTRRDVYILKAGGKKINGFHKKLLKLCRSKLLVPARSVLIQGTKVRICYLRKCMKVGKKSTRMDNQATCKYCVGSGPNRYPSIRFKISSKDMLGNRSLSIIAEANDKLPKNIQNKSFYEVLPQDFWDFVPNNQQQQEPNKRMNLTPYQAFHMLKQLDPEFIKKFVSKRELLFLSCLPVTPNCHRMVETSHVHADGPQLTFDERTKSYRRVLDISKRIDEFRQHQQFRALASAYVTNRVMDCLKASKLHSSMSNGESPSGVSGLKWLKEIMLSKRTDNAFRMTMVGDPKIRLDEIGIPPDLAESLFLGEHVNPYNLDKLNMCCNMHLLTKDEIYTRSKGQLMYVQKTNQFQVGDIVYRPLVDGDVVLINRPPSVHMHSLIALSVKVLPIQSVIAINPLCCAPLCGDFDGDCLHGYVPQSVRCRVELGELVNLDKQLLNAQDGRSLVSLTHDSLTAAHLLTGTQDFLNKFEMQQLAMLFPSQLHMPSIVKSPKLQTPLWSSRQLFSMLLPPDMDYGIGSRNVQICKGEILFSSEMSFWLQNNTSSIFSIMFKHSGRKALDLLFSAQDSLCEYLTLRGLSVSLNDVYMSSDYYSRNKMAEEVYLGLEEAENACRIKQLLLDPKIESLLKNFDESEDPSCIGHYNLWANNPHITQVSVAAFKDVFNDLQKIVQHYVSKDNSLLAMIHAGSKGSLLKLVQQSICLGLQLSASKLPFRIPRKLSCNWWNYLKDLECRMPQDGNECAGGQSSFPVIKASFLEGLNPLESFLHAISGRANLFSENAEIPGTLTRKLMFHMRDLYAAYDGTVRNAYGQQIVQFSYEVSDASSHEDLQSCYMYGGDVARNSAVGAPVGSLAASSISEAAYGGLDHPMNSLETSPLMNLKEVLECGKGRTSVNQAGILYLSKRLQGYRYGLEYGALEVKNHLERVLFSDLVNTVMIFYGGYDVQAVKISPWITHFHEKMMRRGLKVQSVIEELLRNYNSLRKNSEALPALYITNKVCSSIQEWKEHDQTFCISVAVDSSKLMTKLDTIKDAVIPVLLKILIKGFLPFKQVKIQCQSDSVGELYLKVMSENCKHGKFWSSLQNACIPLMDSIDWERSHPEGAYDICSIYGIDAAWKYFLRSLKSSTSNIGRNICREHLLTVTDCLSVTGDFHGLSFRGLKQQRNQLQISSPFNQACFSSPGSCFVNASKQGSVDDLRGTLDAVAWGKEAPVGTAGSFEIIYSGKDPQSEGVKSVYSFLHNLTVEEPNQDNNIACRSTNQSSSSKCKSMPSNASAKDESNVHLISDDHVVDKNSTRYPVKKLASKFKGQSVNVWMRTRHSTSGLQSKFFAEKVGSWANIVDMSTTLRKILHEYPFDGYISETDKSSIIEALAYHPKRDEKVGTGVQQIKIGHSPSHPGTRCFILVRNDGTTVDFSYRKCVIGAAEQISPVLRQLVEKKVKRQR
ncbi:DNA-directed RNA polymerase IV subunit 1 isoform X2 [Typha latifolia]|uniref:DNA-directed RNA polymerase IV subunit 1 isoform X2 n=1 Tax=Typha latifolia TaxID=4733 RepID=UPI003C2DEEE4